MEKELIAMSDCPEVQGKWGPKKGDIMWAKWPGEVLLITTPEINKDYDRKMYIYIPRIEDVLEWLGDRFESLRRIRQATRQVGHTNGSTFHKSTGAHDDIKSLIKAYMYLEHNKTWDGEAWV